MCNQFNWTHWIAHCTASTLCILCIAVPIVFVMNSCLFEDADIGTWTDLLHMNMWQVAVCVYVGIGAFISISLDQTAYQRGNATVVTWLEYSAIPISFAYTAIIFKEMQGTLEIVGVALLTVGFILPGLHHVWIHFRAHKDEAVYEPINDKDVETDTRLPISRRVEL